MIRIAPQIFKTHDGQVRVLLGSKPFTPNFHKSTTQTDSKSLFRRENYANY